MENSIDLHPPRFVYYLTTNLRAGQDLAQQIYHFGFQVQVVEGFHGLESIFVQHAYAAVLIDMDVLGALEPAAQPLSSGRGFRPSGPELPKSGIQPVTEAIRRWREAGIPVIFISSRNDQEARLLAVRLGGVAFFARPVDAAALVDRLEQFDPGREFEPARVLIVESQPTVGMYYQLVLKRGGIDSQLITDPSELLRRLEEYRPELILLDLYLPGVTGLDLTRLIRQVEHFVSIPIVFVSKEDDLDLQMQVMSLGGDDILIKPVKSSQLITVIQNRLQRAQTLRDYMIHDSLTGLLNHTTYRLFLKQQVYRCRRQDSMLSLAMLDLDHFKTVNDTYGHSVGDAVLKSLASLLRQSLRRSDILGRYGGEEFVAVLPDTASRSAFSVVDQLRLHFSQVRHLAQNGREFTVTLSAGIASLPPYESEARLLDAADRALYLAKAQGRNRVILAPPTGELLSLSRSRS